MFLCVCVFACVWNLQGAAEESDGKDRGASPVFSRTSTFCLLVDTVTGRQDEPGGEANGEGGEGGERRQYHLSFIRGQGEPAKVLNAARQQQEENA